MNAQEQFVEDYMLVIENDYVAWRFHMDKIDEGQDNKFTLAENMSDEFDESISNLLDKIDPTSNDWRVNIM